MNMVEQTEGKPEDDRRIRILIDDKPYFAPQENMTGEALKQLAQPLIPANYDLFEEVPGPEEDPLIRNDQVVHLRSGMKFYALPPGNVG